MTYTRWAFAPWALAGTIVVLDRVTKIAIRHSLSMIDSVPVISGLLRIMHTENPGAAFGMLADGSAAVRGVVLIGISLLVLVFVATALWNPKHERQTALFRLGLASVLGGAFGNLYDRLVHHTVTDFIEVYHGGWSFPAFNVADSAISVGAGLILLDLLLVGTKGKADARDLSVPEKHVS